MALGAHMRPYSYMYCAPHRDRVLHRVWPELWAGMAILCEVVLCVIAGNLITCCICVRYVNICVFQCINIMDVNYICLHGTWPEV